MVRREKWCFFKRFSYARNQKMISFYSQEFVFPARDYGSSFYNVLFAGDVENLHLLTERRRWRSRTIYICPSEEQFKIAKMSKNNQYLNTMLTPYNYKFRQHVRDNMFCENTPPART